MGTDDLPVRFPKNSTLSFTPTAYRELVDTLKGLNAYDKALEALEKFEVRIVLRSDKEEGLANALAAMQEAVRNNTRFKAMQHLLNFKPDPREGVLDGCPIGKFLIAK